MTGTDPEQLRRSIVEAAIPLMGEYATLTTAEIARAADVSEADLLVVFADKEAIMQACASALMETARAIFDPAEEVRQLDAIGTEQPLASRLVKVIDILDAYYHRIRIDLHDLQQSTVPATGGVDTPGGLRPLQEGELRSLGNLPEFQQAVARLLEPDGQRLRLPAGILAAAFVGMTAGGVRPTPSGQSPLPAERVVDLFLYGALTTG